MAHATHETHSETTITMDSVPVALPGAIERPENLPNVQAGTSNNDISAPDSLHAFVPSSTLNANSKTIHDLERSSPEFERLESLVKRFNVKVALSTFACALIVAYCSFVNAVVRGTIKYKTDGILYNVGILLSLIAIAFHAGNIVIAGRGAILCSDPDTNTNVIVVAVERPLHYFDTVLSVCEHLHLYGTFVFVIAVFETSFLLFDHYVYPAIFCGLSLLGVVLYLTGKYRKVSLVYRDFLIIGRIVRVRFFRSQ